MPKHHYTWADISLLVCTHSSFFQGGSPINMFMELLNTVGERKNKSVKSLARTKERRISLIDWRFFHFLFYGNDASRATIRKPRNAIRWSKNDLGVFPSREEEKLRIFLEIERFLYGTHVWCNIFFYSLAWCGEKCVPILHNFLFLSFMWRDRSSFVSAAVFELTSQSSLTNKVFLGRKYFSLTLRAKKNWQVTHGGHEPHVLNPKTNYDFHR